ncbi:MAG: hypothetical protein KatS3mg005_4017 [Bryobacteraceae bacterium]|nr:MAG: hypothetical protein KatS3mg005_4017 [Bryobacteraceae bacterium]
MRRTGDGSAAGERFTISLIEPKGYSVSGDVSGGVERTGKVVICEAPEGRWAPGLGTARSRIAGKHGWDAAAAQGRRETRWGRARRGMVGDRSLSAAGAAFVRGTESGALQRTTGAWNCRRGGMQPSRKRDGKPVGDGGGLAARGPDQRKRESKNWRVRSWIWRSSSSRGWSQRCGGSQRRRRDVRRRSWRGERGRVEGAWPEVMRRA